MLCKVKEKESRNHYWAAGKGGGERGTRESWRVNANKHAREGRERGDVTRCRLIELLVHSASAAFFVVIISPFTLRHVKAIRSERQLQ